MMVDRLFKPETEPEEKNSLNQSGSLIVDANSSMSMLLKEGPKKPIGQAYSASESKRKSSENL